MLAFSNDYYGMIFRATQSVELFCAYILSGNPNLKTIPMTQVNLFGQYTSEWNIAIAGMVLGLIPCLLFFLIMQKNIVGGLTDGAVK